jgi:hypothetical protein
MLLRPTIFRGLRLVTITENVTASNDLPWFETLTITENVTASNDLPWFEAVTITENVNESNNIPWFDASYYYKECYCVQRYTVV